MVLLVGVIDGDGRDGREVKILQGWKNRTKACRGRPSGRPWIMSMWHGSWAFSRLRKPMHGSGLHSPLACAVCAFGHCVHRPGDAPRWAASLASGTRWRPALTFQALQALEVALGVLRAPGRAPPENTYTARRPFSGESGAGRGRAAPLRASLAGTLARGCLPAPAAAPPLGGGGGGGQRGVRLRPTPLRRARQAGARRSDPRR